MTKFCTKQKIISIVIFLWDTSEVGLIGYFVKITNFMKIGDINVKIFQSAMSDTG